MPVPMFSTQTDARPSGLVEPPPELTGVTELRVRRRKRRESQAALDLEVGWRLWLRLPAG